MEADYAEMQKELKVLKTELLSTRKNNEKLQTEVASQLSMMEE
jgi:hypothetical protein